jgi:hypothetical protein
LLRVDGNNKFDLVAESREKRDLISLSIRCFAAKNNAQTAETLRIIAEKEIKPEEVIVSDITYGEVLALKEMWECNISYNS